MAVSDMHQMTFFHEGGAIVDGNCKGTLRKRYDGEMSFFKNLIKNCMVYGTCASGTHIYGSHEISQVIYSQIEMYHNTFNL